LGRWTKPLSPRPYLRASPRGSSWAQRLQRGGHQAWERAVGPADLVLQHPQECARQVLPVEPLQELVGPYEDSVTGVGQDGRSDPVLVSKSARQRAPALHQDEDLNLPSTPSTIPVSAERGVGWA
jgi:hypothetical protein